MYRCPRAPAPQNPRQADGLQSLRDLDQVRSVPLGAGPGVVLRSALDAALSRHLLSLPPLDRDRCHIRCPDLGGPHDSDRGAHTQARQRSVSVLEPCGSAWPRPAGATPRSSPPWAWPGGSARSGARPMPSTWPSAARRRRGRRSWRALQGVPHAAPVGRAGAWGLSGHQPAGHGRHHHRELDPDRPGACAG